MCCGRLSWASGGIGWRKGPAIPTPNGYPSTTCRIMGVVAREWGKRCRAPRRGARVGEVREFFDRGDKRTFCEALSEKVNYVQAEDSAASSEAQVHQTRHQKWWQRASGHDTCG